MNSNGNAVLSDSSHGKDQVRVAHVRRSANGTHELVELVVTVRLYGGSDAAFTHGDNSGVVATDTCRNLVYVHAKELGFSTPDLFSLTLAKRVLDTYSHLTKVQIDAYEKPWRRFDRHGTAHDHGFIIKDAGYRAARVSANRESVHHTSMLKDVTVVKTTQSGFRHYIKDKFTTLPETKDRLLATTIDARWEYTADQFDSMHNHDFEFIHQNVREALLFTFFGPPIGGTYSPGLQATMYEMGSAALDVCPQAESITLSLPNLHFLPCNLPVMQRHTTPRDTHVYIPTEEPHGIIKATITRPTTRRARM